MGLTKGLMASGPVILLASLGTVKDRFTGTASAKLSERQYCMSGTLSHIVSSVILTTTNFNTT